MKYESASLILAFVGLATAAPMPDPRNKFTPPTYKIRGREVPQEHSHERFLTGVRINLNLNNPAKIQDPVFGLLGNAAAAVGQGSITNTDCLHQATADQAFTNAKAAGNVTGMVDALSYAALERNTGGVGVASVICNETAVNPEVAAIKQHQDPASAGAAATNKAIVLELAKQIATVGGNPQDALLTGTFQAGSTTDNTGKGNSCDTATDPVGCIFTQNLLVQDATAAEITAAVAGITATAATGAASSNGTAASAASGNVTAAAASTSCIATATTTVDAPATAAATSAAAATASSSTTTTSTSALSFGSCTDPSILFTNNLADRAGATAFVASNQADFPHGSALGIAVISGFICQRLSSSCGASAAANTACTAGQTASASLTGQAAADAFNSALGLSSSSTASTASTSAVAANVVAAATTSSAASASTSSSASGTNVQTFTGSLGGTAPPVTQGTGTRPFTVNGNTFVGKGAALQRSCAIQHNACATAANGGGQSFTVADCGTQETACNAAATA
ncbi:hypothetical protein BP5796_05512 [Coleophoma crateriformis]|uniref:Cell wall mannoprotein n=1 Tax=Coleophoma crateriformis TaxID=565419 RepID=A0A3D8S416_9HELO|nr:hypothetical protein BP5796_05512 [Coleophoma crateriformis]